jgi:nucleoside-diphosphate-sugar epimerase
MKILVTGAGGFVGRRLVALLAKDSHVVYAMVRRDLDSDQKEYCNYKNIHVLKQDLSILITPDLPEDIDVLITLAQSSHFRDFPNRAEEVFEVNVTANLKLLQWAKDTGVKRVVHASSGGIYGGKLGGQFTETDLLAVDSPLGFYLGSKLCSELVFQNFQEFFESMVILRPFFIYGPNQREDMFIARLIESVRNEQAISLQGRNGLRVNPIYVDDAAALFRAALQLSGTHVINVAGPDILTLREIGNLIGQALGKNPIFDNRPGDPVDYIGENSAAMKKLCSATTSFELGVAQTIGISGNI